MLTPFCMRSCRAAFRAQSENIRRTHDVNVSTYWQKLS